MAWMIENADVLEWASRYRGPAFHALLSDPPYELSFGGKWDSTGIAFKSETWAALTQHLLPGGFIMAFASSVGWHRLAVAIEDAGLLLHPTIFNWVRADGWPKSAKMDDPDFAGHRYGRQAIKPAVEPIIVAQKPYAGKPVDSITEHGAGVFNIDGTRIVKGSPPDSFPVPEQVKSSNGFGARKGYRYQPHPGGRWPTNFVLQHAPECEPSICADTCPVRVFENVAGEDGEPVSRFYQHAGWAAEVEERLFTTDAAKYVSRPLTAERDKGVGEEFERRFGGQWGLPGGPREDYVYEGVKRNNHPTVKPIELTRWLATLLLPPDKYAPRRLLVPFCGSFSEGLGGMFAGWEEVLGVEQDQEFATVGRQRAAWWEEALAASTSRVVEDVQAAGDKVELHQGRLL